MLMKLRNFVVKMLHIEFIFRQKRNKEKLNHHMDDDDVIFIDPFNYLAIKTLYVVIKE